MEAKELRIGNYCSNIYEVAATIRAIHPDEKWAGGYYVLTDENKSAIDTIFPIHLTEEWLLKLGLERSKQPNGHIFYGNRAFGMRIIGHPYNDGYVLFGYEGSVDIPYVHTLQNLYFALTNKELRCEAISHEQSLKDADIHPCKTD